MSPSSFAESVLQAGIGLPGLYPPYRDQDELRLHVRRKWVKEVQPLVKQCEDEADVFDQQIQRAAAARRRAAAATSIAAAGAGQGGALLSFAEGPGIVAQGTYVLSRVAGVGGIAGC